MNGTSGLQEVRSSPPRLPSNRLLHEQQLEFGTGSGHLFRTHNLIALSTGINTKKTVSDTFPRSLMGRTHRLAWLLIIMTPLFFVSPVFGIAEDIVYLVPPSDQSDPDPYKVSLPFDPIPIGCNNGPGCRTADHFDWHITLEGDLAESVTLDFTNFPFNRGESIGLGGNIEPVVVGSSVSVYRVTRGESDVLHLASPAQIRTQPDTHWPAGRVKGITINKHILMQLLSTPVRHNGNEVLGTVQVVIIQRIGEVTVGKRRLSLVFDWRWAEKTRCCNDPSDRVDLPLKLGTGSVDNAVIMIDGRRAQGWTNDEIFRDSGTATALVGNYLTDDNLCPESSNGQQCRSEVAVFEKHHALRLDTPVFVWTDRPIDVHTMSSPTPLLTVPVKMWVLWENANSTTPPSTTTEDLAIAWVDKANQLYDRTRCGIQFEISSIENKVPEATRTNIPNTYRTLQQVACEESEINSLKAWVGYSAHTVNVYFTATVSSTERGFTCTNFNANVILIRTPQAMASDETLAHELGHTLGLDHTSKEDSTGHVTSIDYNNDTVPDFDGTNLMWEGGLNRNKVSLGQCFRCNVNSWSALYENNIPNAIFTGKTPRDCFGNDDNFNCPRLNQSE